jgi:hypothetical protein
VNDIIPSFNNDPSTNHKPLQLQILVISLFLVYAFGYPVGNSAVLGCFSNIQKRGKQGRLQSHFALMGSLARVIFPLLTSYVERFIATIHSAFNNPSPLLSGSEAGPEKVHYFTAFGLVLLLSSISSLLVFIYEVPIRSYDEISYRKCDENNGKAADPDLIARAKSNKYTRFQRIGMVLSLLGIGLSLVAIFELLSFL